MACFCLPVCSLGAVWDLSFSVGISIGVFDVDWVLRKDGFFGIDNSSSLWDSNEQYTKGRKPVLETHISRSPVQTSQLSPHNFALENLRAFAASSGEN